MGFFDRVAGWFKKDVPVPPEPLKVPVLERARLPYLEKDAKHAEWRMFTMEELIRGFSIHDYRICKYCGAVYPSLSLVHHCVGCGGPLDEKVHHVVQKEIEKKVVHEAVAKRDFSPWLGEGKGVLEILCDDGDVQVEPFEVVKGERYARFTNTMNTFFVNRKNGCIVDMQMVCSNPGSGMLRFKVNGKDTGVRKPIAALVPTINSRMPTTYPIAAGTAIQLEAIE